MPGPSPRMPFLHKGIVAGNNSVAKLGEAVLRAAVGHQAGQGLDISALIKSWIESLAQRQRMEPERQPSSLLLAPPPRNKRRMVFVLGNPHSGRAWHKLLKNPFNTFASPRFLS